MKKQKEDIFAQIEAHDLVKYGLIPELVGRIPLITSLTPLDTEAFVRILKEPKNALTKQYSKLFELDGVELEFEDEALEEIAKLASERNTGARGLRAITEEIMTDIMYTLPDDKELKKVVITKGVVNNTEKPKLQY